MGSLDGTEVDERDCNWHKRSPHDCGRPGCSLCHGYPKGHPRHWPKRPGRKGVK